MGESGWLQLGLLNRIYFLIRIRYGKNRFIWNPVNIIRYVIWGASGIAAGSRPR